MENLSLVSSPKVVLGLSPNLKSPVFVTKPYLGVPRNFSPRKSSSCQAAKRGKPFVLAKLEGEHFASISSSKGQQTSSVGVNPLPVQSPSSQVGSPLFWVGVGVGLSALFSWVAAKLKNYAMQQAFKTMMGQMNTQNNQFGNASFSPNSPFPFPPSPSVSTSASPPSAASQSATVDISATKVEEAPAKSIKDVSEPRKQPKKYAFVDVSPEETIQKSAFENYKESAQEESSEDPVVNQKSPNGAAFKLEEEGAFQASSSSANAGPPLSVDALEKMLEDPTMQKMVFPYLPEEMRNPESFKWMLQNPMYRQQLQEMLNNMGGSPEWDNRMLDNLKNFDLNSPEIKQQFDQIGLSPEEVISKIMANPDVAMAFQNPRVQAAIMDCSQNPMSITKYQNDKEVMDVFNKISELFPGTTGF